MQYSSVFRAWKQKLALQITSKTVIKLTPGIACVAGAITGGEGDIDRSAKAKTHTQMKNGIPVANPREPWALESDNLNLNLETRSDRRSD